MFLGWAQICFLIYYCEADFCNGLFIAMETEINNKKKTNEKKIKFPNHK